MPNAIIKGISRLRGMGVFADARSGEVPDFSFKNLLYGFNAAGKTTLSRMFASVAAGRYHPALPEGGSFEFALSDSSRIASTSLQDNPLRGRLFVFNSDYVEENLKWREGISSPIFYLGRDQADAADQLQIKTARLLSLGDAVGEADKRLSSEQQTLTDMKRRVARGIAEALGLGRRYEAPQLVQDYKDIPPAALQPLDDESLRAVRTTLTMQEHPAPLPKTEPLQFRFADLFAEVRDLLTTTIDEIKLTDLQRHDSMLIWVSNGLRYHSEHHLDDCLFCGNRITQQRIESLKASLDGSLTRVVEQALSLKIRVAGARTTLELQRQGLPRATDLSPGLRAEFDLACETHSAVLEEGKGALSRALELLAEKTKRPNLAISIGALLDPETAARWDRKLHSIFNSLDQLIERHNQAHTNFSGERQDALKRLKYHFLAIEKEAYTRCVGRHEAAESTATLLRDEKVALEAEIRGLRQQIRQDGPPAAAINSLLKNYLGRADIEVEPREDAFSITRNGTPLVGPLSEGEKTALALCYFLVSLEGEGRQIRDLIVVVDDPVSSLDSRALNYAFSFLRVTLRTAGQLILLTHNLHFMNESKKWLARAARNAESSAAAASLLFLDTSMNADGKRSSRIVQMPALIKDYESEYHHLFSILYAFCREGGAFAGNFYLLPNAIRKVLEVFLAFHAPGAAELSNKLEQIVSENGGTLDAVQLGALNRLVQLESHADSVEDLVSLSPITLEETGRAASAVFLLMEAVAPEHYRRMERLSRRG